MEKPLELQVKALIEKLKVLLGVFQYFNVIYLPLHLSRVVPLTVIVKITETRCERVLSELRVHSGHGQKLRCDIKLPKTLGRMS